MSSLNRRSVQMPRPTSLGNVTGVIPQGAMSSNGLSEAIQNLPPELREMILKEYIARKIKEKKEMGWDEVHDDLKEAPICEKRSRIVKVMFCRKCNSCGLKGLCYECYKNREKHYLGYPVYDENYYAEIFQKFY